MTLYLAMFLAGVLTILLPCILPLIPIVLGVSIAGKSRLRPLCTVLGMLVSFVGFTFLLQVLLSQFIEVADYLRIATYYILLLFGLNFIFQKRVILFGGAVTGGLFFLSKGWISVIIASILGVIATEIGGHIASSIQQLGTDVQGKARKEFGTDSPFTAFIIGLTMGLVWVPCAGPALGFALTLVRDAPGLKALALLTTYGMGTAIPLLIIGYSGQYAVRSVRILSQYSGIVKQVSGGLLLLTALAFQFQFFTAIQTFLVTNTDYGTLGTEIEEKLFGESVSPPLPVQLNLDILQKSSSSSLIKSSIQSALPFLLKAPELASAGPWHNSVPLTLAGLRGKIVLVDFWTYSCINCIRTLPYLQGYAEKYQDSPVVILGVHSPEFIFEKSEKNVQDAIKRHGLTYPIVQDNDFGTWKEFDNHYWPAKYLIDAQGTIRYTHFGEGNYEETDAAIASLLKEMGIQPSEKILQEETVQPRRELTPETYIGSRSWDSLGNAKGNPTYDILSYSAPATPLLHRYYLDGQWQLVDDEHQVLRSAEGSLTIRALAGEVNLVLGIENNAAPVKAEVFVDGSLFKRFSIDRHDLFTLYKGDYGEHTIVLKIHGKNVSAYAYTFGG
jgi:cytochrome c biogenesis protein CcdA/thiol-disulfide isomerase/thioredoxin